MNWDSDLIWLQQGVKQAHSPISSTSYVPAIADFTCMPIAPQRNVFDGLWRLMLALHSAVQSDDYIAILWRDYVSRCCLESLHNFVRLQGTNNNVHHPKWEHKQRWWYLILHWTSQLSTWKRDNKSGCCKEKKSLPGAVSTHGFSGHEKWRILFLSNGFQKLISIPYYHLRMLFQCFQKSRNSTTLGVQ